MMTSPITKHQKWINQEWTYIWVLSFVFLIHIGFLLMIYFPFAESPDIQTYLGLAQFDFEQSAVRKYRILVPFLAAALDFLLHPVIDLFKPWSFDQDFSLCFCFLFINSTIMATAILFLYKLCRQYELSAKSALLGIAVALSSRWTYEISALPLVDGLYFCCTVFCLYGLLFKNKIILGLGILIGPWSKESFLFFIPLYIYLAYPSIKKLFIQIVLSGIIVFLFRYLFDLYTGNGPLKSLEEDLGAIKTIPESISRLLSLHGLYELVSVPGLFLLLISVTWLKNRQAFQQFFKGNKNWIPVYFIIVLFHALLSMDIGRMFYLSIPVFVLWTAVSAQILINNRNGI